MSRIFRKTSFRRAFTLIEIVIASGILVLLIVGFTVFLVYVMDAFRAVRAREEVIAEANAAMFSVSHELREAVRVYTPTSVFDSDLGQLSLETREGADVNDGITYVDFYVDTGVLYTKHEGEDPVAITSERVSVDAFRIETRCPSYHILISLQAQDGTQISFRTSATARVQEVCL